MSALIVVKEWIPSESRSAGAVMANRTELLKKYGSRCAYCGDEIDLKTMQTDHKIPLRRGDGPPDKELLKDKNLMPSCAPCNRWKSVLSIEEFRHEIDQQVKRVRRDSAGFRMAERYHQIEVTGNTHIPDIRYRVRFYFEKLEQKYGSE